MAALQFLRQRLQGQQVRVGLPPQPGGFAEGPDVARMAEREDQPRNVGAGIAPTQKTGAGCRLVRFGLLQRLAGLQVTQRNLQCPLGILQILQMATRQVTAERCGGILLPPRPVALAGDPCGRCRLQLLDHSRQRDQADRHARQQRKSQSQPAGHRYPSALLVHATSTHPGSPECAAVTISYGTAPA